MTIASKTNVIHTLEANINQENPVAFSYFRLAKEYFREKYDKDKVKKLFFVVVLCTRD